MSTTMRRARSGLYVPRAGGGGGGGTFRDAVLALSPLFYWRLGEATGATVAVDETGNGRHGGYTGATTLVPGLLSADANGATTESCQIASAAWMPAADLTIMTLVQSASNSGNQGIVTRFNANSDWLLWKDTSSRYAVRFYNTGGSQVDLAATGRGSTGDLAFLVATYTSGAACLYVDGTLVASSASLTGAIKSATNPIEVGAYQGGAFDFNGVQDETAVFDYALSGSDVAALAALV